MKFHVGTVFATAMFAVTAIAQGVLNGENPISAPPPSGGAELTANVPYAITWTPTSSGTVSLILYKGPAANLVDPITIAAKIANSGTFLWTPAIDLEGLQTMTSAGDGYGFKIVNDATQNFDWSGHFVLSSPGSTFDAASSSVASSSVPATSSTPSSTPSSSTPAPSTSSVSSTSAPAPTTSSTTAVASTSSVSSSVSSSATSTSASTSSVPSTSSVSSTKATSASSSASSTSATSTESTTSASTTVSSTASTTSAASTTMATTSASTTSATPSSTASTNPEPTSSPSASATTAPARSKLSTVAIAGVSVGVIAAIAGCAIGAFLVRRRRQTRRESEMFGTRGAGAYDAEFAMMERSRESGGFLSSNYNRMPEYGEIGTAQSRF